MWISHLDLRNVRSFVDKCSIDFSKNINIIVGRNNSGKTTILLSILHLQKKVLNSGDVNIKENEAELTIYFEGREDCQKYFNSSADKSNFDSVRIHLPRTGSESSQFRHQHQTTTFLKGSLQNYEPGNLIYPFLSKRKVMEFSEEINQNTSNAVKGNFENLYAKIDRISNPQYQPQHNEYQKACKDILGFQVSAVASEKGKIAAYFLNNSESIPITSMGEGIPNLLGLIVDLCVAENQIFIIEEPENDIHPKALKALLELIARKSENNQFFISTHSNIVTKYLGSIEESKVFRVAMSFNQESRLPVSEIVEVENEPIARLQLLEELGYEPFDFGQWKAWLILEESSAEVIIRDFLIPAFALELKTKLRTYSARTLSEVEPKFKDFNNLFVFIHLEQIYKNNAWVLIDAGENEGEIINKMRETYSQSGWDEENFLQFSQHDFEKYYPEIFQGKVTEILAITNKKEKMQLKKELLEEVKQWIKDFPDEAKQEFAVSAKEVIDILESINKKTE